LLSSSLPGLDIALVHVCSRREPLQGRQPTATKECAVNAATFVTDHAELTVEKTRPGLYRLSTADRTTGWVEHVGTVWVALRGRRYDRAEEVGQALDFQAAAAMLARR
jgi:hypothetical protein